MPAPAYDKDTAPTVRDRRRAPAPWRARRLLLPLLLGLALAAFFALGLQRYLDCATLAEHRGWLLAQVQRFDVAAALLFILIYAAATAVSVPGGAALTVAGGFLFGIAGGTIYAVVGATIGATLLFLIARSAIGDWLRVRAGPWLARMERGFARNALSYLLVLRLIPLFPFFAVNLVPALLNVPLGTYVLGTFVGIIPGTLVFASFGAGLGRIFDSGGECRLENVLTTEVLIALAGLAMLALLPVFYKKLVRPGGSGSRSSGGGDDGNS